MHLNTDSPALQNDDTRKIEYKNKLSLIWQLYLYWA